MDIADKQNKEYINGSKTTPAVFIKTYGCQMNERDSEAIAGMLSRLGYRLVDHESLADILIFNTCSVRDQAERKAIGKIGLMKKLKQQRPGLIVGVMGCMAQNRGEELIQSLPHLDFVIGSGQLHKLPETLDAIIANRHKISLLSLNDEILTSMGMHHEGFLKIASCQAYIAITRGCNRFCSYCIVPRVRGREISRSERDVLAEARQLVDSGVREIILLGQNVAAYGLHGDTRPPTANISPFAALLTKLSAIEGLYRIRFTSPYPSYFNNRLISTIADLPKVCRHIHLPLQSGSDRVLQRMNRQYTAGQYLDIVNKLRERVPDISFSTDIIVGFPGETDADFNATRAIMRKVDFDNAFIFKYSPRSGTPAAREKQQTPQKIREERNQLLLADQKIRTAAHNKQLVGTIQEILVEGPSKRNSQHWNGKTTNARGVMFTPSPTIRSGQLLRIRIQRCSAASLFGVVEDDLKPL